MVWLVLSLETTKIGRCGLNSNSDFVIGTGTLYPNCLCNNPQYCVAHPKPTGTRPQTISFWATSCWRSMRDNVKAGGGGHVIVGTDSAPIMRRPKSLRPAGMSPDDRLAEFTDNAELSPDTVRAIIPLTSRGSQFRNPHRRRMKSKVFR